MTFREKMKIEHPNEIGELYDGGCSGCPCDYGYEKDGFMCKDAGLDCTKCWDREMPEAIEIPENKKEAVNHPSHYNREGSMECIEEMVLVFGKQAVMNFCLCNAWKYRYRAADKNGAEDFGKSDWYMAKFKELRNDGKLPF